MRVPIPFGGQSYSHKDLDLSAQTCKNWVPELNSETNTLLSLQPWPGLTLFSLGSGVDGGSYTFQNILYKVTDQTLHSVSSSGVQTSIGTIASSGLCTFAHNNDELVIVRGGNVYSFDGTTLTKSSNSAFESPDYVTVINNQAIYDGIGQRFVVSDPEALTDINALNFAGKESKGDDLVRPYSINETLYLFGEKSISRWWNSGQGNPPFDPIQNSTIERGVKSGRSIANNGQFGYFLGDDLIVYRLQGQQIQQISTIPLSQEFKTYPFAEDAIGVCFALNGQNFYYLKFPTGKTWVYSETSNGWIELTTENNQLPYKGTSYAEAYDKQFFSIGGSIYYLDTDNYTNNNETIIRERISSTISAGFYDPSLEGRSLFMNSVELVVKTEGLATGQGSDPTVLFAYSDDSGRTWTERMLKGSPLGRYTWRLKTEQLGSFYERLIRIRISDPIKCSLYKASAEMEVSV